MINYNFSVEDASRVRLAAFSPIGEIVFSIRTITAPHRDRSHLPWVQAVSPRLRAVDLRPLFAVIPPTGYIPDFLTPPPKQELPDLREELEAVRATAPERMVEQLGWLDCDTLIPAEWRSRYAPVRRELLADPSRGAYLLAQLLHDFWQLAVQPYWPRMRNWLKTYAFQQSQVLANAGNASYLSNLNDQVRCDNGRVTVASDYDYSVDLDGGCLLLWPSVFSGSRVLTMLPPDQPMLIYQSPGVETLWQRAALPANPLTSLMGYVRATILELVASPASTTELAQLLSVTPGAVSQHLNVLRENGLVSSSRRGRSVLYQRTDVGDTLISAALR